MHPLYNAPVKITNGLVPNERICGVTSSTKYELLLIFCFVVVVLFLPPFVSVLVIGPRGIMQPYQSFQRYAKKLQYREKTVEQPICSYHIH